MWVHLMDVYARRLSGVTCMDQHLVGFDVNRHW